jgi:hypothetical protein
MPGYKLRPNDRCPELGYSLASEFHERKFSHASLSPLLLAIAFLLIPRLSQAQVALGPSTPSPVTAPAKVDPATEKKALDLVESLSEQVSNLHSPSNRMRAQCMVADLLWSRDEKRARSLFTAAVNQLAAGSKRLITAIRRSIRI